MDSRYIQLARNLVGFSVNLKEGERVLIDAYNTPMDMVISLVRAVRERDGLPFVQLQDSTVNREIISEGLQEQFDELAAYELDRMKRMDAYIAIRGSSNIFEHSDVPPEQMSKFSKVTSKLAQTNAFGSTKIKMEEAVPADMAPPVEA